MYDIIIIGAGCAGMTSALYALRAGKKVLLLECEVIGGQISSSPKVENYPSVKQMSGLEFSDNLFSQIESLNVEFAFEKAIKIVSENNIKKVITEENTYETKTIIVATGLKYKLLGVDNEAYYIGRGLSYCAVCDGAFYKNKVTAVIGGGNTALQDAIYLSQYCKKVYVIHRRDTFRGEKFYFDILSKKENVEYIYDSVIEKINGDPMLESLDIKNLKTNLSSNLKVDGMFVAVGQAPNNSLFSDVLQLDEAGYIISGEDCKTSTEGIFAAGDCRTKEIRQLTTAAADGAVAAIAAVNYIDRM